MAPLCPDEEEQRRREVGDMARWEKGAKFDGEERKGRKSLGEARRSRSRFGVTQAIRGAISDALHHLSWRCRGWGEALADLLVEPLQPLDSSRQ